MKQIRLFSSFLSQLSAFNKSPAAPVFSTSTTIQSSVGLIFRFKPSEIIEQQPPRQSFNRSYALSNLQYLHYYAQRFPEIQLLVAQRAGYEKDLNAYNLVFPGGQADHHQSDLQACKRELQQQIAIDVDQLCTYLGRLPQNFYYAKKKNKKVYISCHIWILNQNAQFQPTLNKDQLIDYKWVNFDQFANPSNLTVFNAREFSFIKRLGWKFLREGITKNLTQVHFAGLNLGLKRDLWGLTLWIVHYILQMSQSNLSGCRSYDLKQRYLQASSIAGQQISSQKLKQIQQIQKSLLKQIRTVTNRIKWMDLKFGRSYLIGVPMVFLAKSWHYWFRARQFTYGYSKAMKNMKKLSQQSVNKQLKYKYAGFIALLALIVIYITFTLQ